MEQETCESYKNLSCMLCQVTDHEDVASSGEGSPCHTVAYNALLHRDLIKLWSFGAAALEHQILCVANVEVHAFKWLNAKGAHHENVTITP
eukprot:2540314-Amphidinium_carterae.2